MNQPSVIDLIRIAILAESDRGNQYDEIASVLGVTRHQAKALYFAFMYQAEPAYLAGMVAAFESMQEIKR